MSNLLLIKKDPISKIRVYMQDLIRADSITGAKRADAIMQIVGTSVQSSFLPGCAPARNITKDMLTERLDKCVDLVLRLVDLGWVSTRIIDRVEQLFLREMRDGKPVEITTRSAWGVKEDSPVELEV